MAEETDITQLFSQPFDNEARLVEAIKRYLMTAEVQTILTRHDMSIEDLLNGRFSPVLDCGTVARIFGTWNKRIGHVYFRFD